MKGKKTDDIQKQIKKFKSCKKTESLPNMYDYINANHGKYINIFKQIGRAHV